jgi:prophage DNA circulation protein
MEERDRYLTDYSLPFRGDADTWVVDHNYIQRSFELARQTARKDWTVDPSESGGVSMHVSESGGLTMLQGASGAITVTAEGLEAFMNSVIAAWQYSRTVAPPLVRSYEFSQNYKVAHASENAVNKQRNEKRMAHSLKIEQQRQDDLMYAGLAHLERMARGW